MEKSEQQYTTEQALVELARLARVGFDALVTGEKSAHWWALNPLDRPLQLTVRISGRTVYGRNYSQDEFAYISRFEPSGGVFLKVRLSDGTNTPKPYGTISDHILTSRLGPGWTEAQIIQRLRLLVSQVTGDGDDLIALRNRVWLRFEGHKFTAIQDALVESMSPHMDALWQAKMDRTTPPEAPAGWHNPIYNEMSADDCRFWLTWADEQGIPDPAKD